MNKLTCLRCGTEMKCRGAEQLQLGKTGLLFGDWSNILAGALEVEVWVCPQCRKVEFFGLGSELPEEEEDHMAHIICPNCGYEHELDDPKCPNCGSKNTQM